MSRVATKKFGRERDLRRALLKSLADSLILDESVETTLPKAKAVARYTEKLVTKAKKSENKLHQRRMVISSLNTLEAAHKLVDEIAPKLTGRQSGYFRIEKLTTRQGDNALVAKVSFVDDLKSAKKSQKKVTQSDKSKPPKEDEGKPDVDQSKPAVDSRETKIQPKMTAQAPKRSGVRGNR